MTFGCGDGRSAAYGARIESNSKSDDRGSRVVSGATHLAWDVYKGIVYEP